MIISFGNSAITSVIAIEVFFSKTLFSFSISKQVSISCLIALMGLDMKLLKVSRDAS